MKIAIMQPYFLPYIGYFQLINSVDKFVIYDDVQFIKRGWINKNKMIVNGVESFFRLNLKKDVQELNINERYFACNIEDEIRKILKGIELAYKKAPYFEQIMPLVNRIFEVDKQKDISKFLIKGLTEICSYLDIRTEIIISSSLEKDNSLKAQDKIINIVQHLDADTYINAIGGQSLYSKEEFKNKGIELLFLKSNPIVYKQFKNDFIPNLSILDILMFNSIEEVKVFLSKYEVV